MLPTTANAVKAMLQADPSITPEDRNTILVTIKSHGNTSAIRPENSGIAPFPAKATLEAFITKAKSQLQPAYDQIRAIKQEEFAEWERANPEAAAMKRLESRVRSAEFAARKAESKAEQAADDSDPF